MQEITQAFRIAVKRGRQARRQRNLKPEIARTVRTVNPENRTEPYCTVQTPEFHIILWRRQFVTFSCIWTEGKHFWLRFSCASRISKLHERMNASEVGTTADGLPELDSKSLEGQDDNREQQAISLEKQQRQALAQLLFNYREKCKHRRKASICRRDPLAIDWGKSREGTTQDKRRAIVRYLESLRQLPSTSSYVRHRVAMLNKALELLDRSGCADASLVR